MAAISTVVAEITRHAAGFAEQVLPGEKVLGEYLRGPECASVIGLLCNLEHTERSSVEVRDERESLRKAFEIEVVRVVGQSGQYRKRSQIAMLWAEIERVVRNKVVKIAASDKIVIRATGPDHSINERLGLAQDPQRRLGARMTGALIREAMADAHDRMFMPHSRIDFRFATERIYVPRRLRVKGQAHAEPVLEELLSDRRFVIVGNPGAGKSTFIRNLVRRVATGDDGQVPMLVLLKQHQRMTGDFVSIIARELRTLVQRQVPRQDVADLLSSGDGLVVFDGLDELGEVHSRRAAVTAIEAFAARFPLARIVVTCRQESYPVASLDPGAFPVYWLPDFFPEQVEWYVHTWFSLVPHYGESRAEPFLRDSEHLRGLRSNPLMLSLLCMLYQSEGYIPENTADVYRECAELMLVRWDAVGQVVSANRLPVKLVKFLVQELAQHFFFELDGVGAEGEQTLRHLVVRHLSEREEEDARTYHQQAQDFLDFCAERAWVLTQVDTGPGGERMFGFTHRTFMEYYTACHVLRKHESATALVECLLPMITSGKSHVVPQIALQMFDNNRADGGDTCVLLMLERADEQVITFCLGYYRYNHLRHSTADALLEKAFELYGRNGRMLHGLEALLGAKLARGKVVARNVVERTEDDRYAFTDIRFGAGSLWSDPSVAYEVLLGELRFGHQSPAAFARDHGARNLVWTWLPGGECVPGPVVRAIGDLARLGRGWRAVGSMTSVGAGLAEMVPVPLSVVARLTHEFDLAGADLLHQTFRSGRGGFTGLFCLVAAAAVDASMDWGLPGALLDRFGVRSGLAFEERLLAFCDDNDAMKPFRECLRLWADGELAFVGRPVAR